MRGVRPTEIDDFITELNAEYAAEGSPYSIGSFGAGHQLDLRPEFGSLRAAFYGRIREARLSQAAVDILAIIAYHQPVTAEVIDRLRGKPSGAILSQLLRRDLIALERSPEAKSKPTYRTTGRFLEIFGLDGIADLPQSQESSR
jgi:segregation and condensation protein B